ncbi:MAG: hypothetical protein F6J90_03045 [Moorea sp. SIOASIH]|uniref:hypothetical protein n=1 Tax=Moorena sp. SIOASIH TaxID=2607817 RepID=UPI0013BE3081|nr:hypothetical protein [Moorena sp. SIOASIH]NEO35335.1 hypothetical protein [Moorena sp. SIOASIH]
MQAFYFLLFRPAIAYIELRLYQFLALTRLHINNFISPSLHLPTRPTRPTRPPLPTLPTLSPLPISPHAPHAPHAPLSPHFPHSLLRSPCSLLPTPYSLLPKTQNESTYFSSGRIQSSISSQSGVQIFN